jgi:hypothetical protein
LNSALNFSARAVWDHLFVPCRLGSKACRGIDSIAGNHSDGSLDGVLPDTWCGPGYEGLTCAACSPGFGKARLGMCRACARPRDQLVAAAAGLLFVLVLAYLARSALRPVRQQQQQQRRQWTTMVSGGTPSSFPTSSSSSPFVPGIASGHLAPRSLAHGEVPATCIRVLVHFGQTLVFVLRLDFRYPTGLATGLDGVGSGIGAVGISGLVSLDCAGAGGFLTIVGVAAGVALTFAVVLLAALAWERSRAVRRGKNHRSFGLSPQAADCLLPANDDDDPRAAPAPAGLSSLALPLLGASGGVDDDDGDDDGEDGPAAAAAAAAAALETGATVAGARAGDDDLGSDPSDSGRSVGAPKLADADAATYGSGAGSATTSAVSQMTRAMVALTMVLHPTVMIELLRMVRPCVHIGSHEDSPPVLFDDVAVRCDTPRAVATRTLAAVALVVFGLLMPAVLFWRLHRAARALRARPGGSSEPGAIVVAAGSVGHLARGYAPGCHMWEVAILARKYGIVVLATFAQDDPRLQAVLASILLVLALQAHVSVRPFLHCRADEADAYARGARDPAAGRAKRLHHGIVTMLIRAGGPHRLEQTALLANIVMVIMGPLFDIGATADSNPGFFSAVLVAFHVPVFALGTLAILGAATRRLG